LLKTQPLTRSFGTVVLADPGTASLSDLAADEVIRLYKTHGAILFRGFPVDGDRFTRFSERFSAEFVINGNLTRESASEDGRTQTVNSGHQLIPMHSEMAYSPFRPEILWFFCEVPPRRKGETMLCDGVEVWSRLSQATRDLFLKNPIRYTFRGIPARFAGLIVGRPVDLPEVERMLDGISGVRYQVHDDGTLDLSYVVSAVNTPKHGKAHAFANSVIVESERVSFADGTPISRDLRLDLFEVTSAVAFLLKWQAGDLLMIDNSRIMHGRVPFANDDRRRILVRMGRETFA
jgi:alpha-ketoglutarate-dependent taurine dioxygenase